MSKERVEAFCEGYRGLCAKHGFAVAASSADGQTFTTVVPIHANEAPKIADYLSKRWQVDERVRKERQAAEQEIFEAVKEPAASG